MNVTVAAVATSPVPGAPCAGVCGGDTAGGVDFAAVLLSLSTGSATAASPETLLGALVDGLPGEPVTDDTAAGEAATDPLQNLLAGLLAIPTASAAATAGEGEPLGEAGGDEIAMSATNSKRNTAEAQTLLAAKADAAGKLADEAVAANPVLPAAAKLADGKLATAAEPAGADLKTAPNDDGSPSAPTQQTLAAPTTNNAARGAAAIAHVQAPVGSQAWAGDMSQRVVMLARSDMQSAQITLNPAHLGPLEVRLNISNGEATAVFTSAHSDVREALETALPRLREMFASAGIQLGQAQVNAQSTGSGGQGDTPGSPASLVQRTEVAGGLADNDEIQVTRPLARGLVDTFA